jgi:type II secretory pathway pseudopilin PulG
MFRTTSSRAQKAEGRGQKNGAVPLRSALCALRSDEGFSLAALIVLLTIISLIIAYTVPMQWSMVMKRERDRQTIFLMKQFARGIMQWQQKHNTQPVSLQQLQDARKPLMLRNGGKWPCPLTGSEDDWILVPPTAVTAEGQVIPGAVGTPGRNPATNPQGQQPQPGSGPMKLNKELSPADYVGPFIGVRPNATGKSFIELNGAENYDEWVYTVFDLTNEIAARNQQPSQ